MYTILQNIANISKSLYVDNGRKLSRMFGDKSTGHRILHQLAGHFHISKTRPMSLKKKKYKNDL